MDMIELETIQMQDVPTHPDNLSWSDSSLTNGIYGELPVSPRIGDDYQVEIPALATKSKRLQFKESLAMFDSNFSVDCDTAMELQIPVTWVPKQWNNLRSEQKEFPTTSIDAIITGSREVIDYKGILFGANQDMIGGSPVGNSDSCLLHYQCSKVKMEFDFKTCGMNKGIPMMHSSLENNYTALPGSPPSSWSDAESQSFLLSLYIFGKNLVQVRKFIECKEMGDILSYYYGAFFRSDAYRRWLECRKTRSRKCIIGHRIFTGWRQQELLSRIFPSVSKDVQDSLSEITKSFNDGRSSLEELVFTLKAKVGIQVLVEAIGIGKGKHDLTGTASDPVRSNHEFSIRPEIPTGKACSFLSSGDIVKFLTGNFRLSKARSNDLFWEAVWPRLLARGWHSEQPKDANSIASKNSLVFLVAGIKKFSRRKLVKGIHYFDSVSDILNNVASNPKLLELDDEKADLKNENGWAMENKREQNDHYLSPRVSDDNSELMKFTVVDTSLFEGEGPLKIRELRTLPTDPFNIPSIDTGETGGDSSSKEQDSDDYSADDRRVSAPSSWDKKKAEQSDVSSSALYYNIDPSGIISTTIEQIEGEECVPHLGMPANDTKCQLNHRTKTRAYLTPVTKRRRLIAFKHEGTSRCTSSKEQQLAGEGIPCNVVATSHPLDCASFPIFSSSVSAAKKDMHISNEDCKDNSVAMETTFSVELPQSHPLIDLNRPPNVSLDHEVGDKLDAMNKLELNLALAGKDSLTDPVSQASATVGTSTWMHGHQQGSGNSCRKSSRNRPPTTKALESLAFGFIGTKRKGRDSRDLLSGNTSSRPSRRARRIVKASSPVLPASIAASDSCFEIPNAATREWNDSNTSPSSVVSNSCSQSDREGLNGMLCGP